MLLDNIEIIVGTYEEFLLGYQVKHVDGVYNLVQTFANHGHRASIRCATSNGIKLASGGSDETIHLYDMVKRKEAEILMHHSGTVSCIAFSPDGSHLLSGGEDGMLAITRVGSFILEKSFGSAHKGSAIFDISVHPSGKLALTVGADGTLRTWNLVKGRQAYATRLASTKCGAVWQISGLCWSTEGNFYAVAIGSKVDVYSVESAAIVYSITTETKICDFCFLNNNTLCIGCESGTIYIYNVKEKCHLAEKKAHDQRVKCVESISSEHFIYIVTASSSGNIKLWEYKGKALHELSKVATGCRITCLTIPMCGFPTNFKEEKTMDIEFEKLHVPLRPLKKDVLIVEEEGETRLPQSMKRKKKKTVQVASSLLKVKECEKVIKKKKVPNNELSNSFKLKKLKSRKRSSTGNLWEISDIKT